jgi:glucarate dehydratase
MTPNVQIPTDANGSRAEPARTSPKPSVPGSRIERVEVDRVFVPFKQEIQWSAGRRPGTTRLVVRVHTADGTVGVGETICLLEFIEPVLIRTLIPLAVGEDAFDVERICRKAEGAGYYHHKRALVMALCGLEMALWDVIGKKAGLPLHQLWGGSYREDVPLVAYLQSGDPRHIAREAAGFVEQGYGTVKVKLGLGEDRDVELVKAVREAVGPRVKVRGDANGAWTVGTAKRLLRKLEAYDLEYVEQPLPLEDLPGHALLRKQSSVPIALDESAYTLQDVMAIVRQEAADVVLLDPHEAGGLLATRKAAAVCEAAGIPVTLHSGAELGVSLAAYLHLAASIPNLLLAIDNQTHNIAGDVVTDPVSAVRGTMRPPTGPGLGVRLDPERVRRHRADGIANPYLDPDRPGWFPTKPQY